MIERRELEKLKEVIEYSMPQIADYNPRSGRYSIELAMTKHIDLGEGDHHILFAQGYLRKETISLSIVSNEQVLLNVNPLPYIANQGDRTPIYKILRASIYFAYAMVNLPTVHRKLKKIPSEHFPFNISDTYEQKGKEIAFMKDLFKLLREKSAYRSYLSVILHKNASKLKEAISFCDYQERGIKEKIKYSMKQLSPYIPDKDKTTDITPDILVCDHMEDSKDYYNCQIISLNSNNKSKEEFWWEYLKLNIFLSCVEYKNAYCILLNRWTRNNIKNWIDEYRQKNFYEAEKAKDNIVFYIKAGYKASPRILNCNGTTIPTKVLNSYK